MALQPAADHAVLHAHVLVVCAGCILMLTLQGQPAESDPYRLTKMIKEALGPDKIRFVEQQRQQGQQPATADTAAPEQQPDSEPAQDMQHGAEPQPEMEGQQGQQQQAAGSRQVCGLQWIGTGVPHMAQYARVQCVRVVVA
jgi:hypothetical protein